MKDHWRRNRIIWLGVAFFLVGGITVYLLLPKDGPPDWMDMAEPLIYLCFVALLVLDYRRCPAVWRRFNTSRRCNLRRNHDGVHLSAQGEDRLYWTELEAPPR